MSDAVEVEIEGCGQDAAGPYQNIEEIESLIRQFEDLTLPKASWTHQAHLTVALWYLLHYSGQQATSRIREGIKRYNDKNGVRMTPTGGYHETLTLFWIVTISRYLMDVGHGKTITELANGLIRNCAHKELPFKYYSRERLMSWAARTSWMEPDLNVS